MTGYTIIGITMGDVPFIHKDKVYTEWLGIVRDIEELLYGYQDIDDALINEHFWIADTFYKVHTVEIISDKGLTDEL